MAWDMRDGVDLIDGTPSGEEIKTSTAKNQPDIVFKTI